MTIISWFILQLSMYFNINVLSMYYSLLFVLYREALVV